MIQKTCKHFLGLETKQKHCWNNSSTFNFTQIFVRFLAFAIWNSKKIWDSILSNNLETKIKTHLSQWDPFYFYYVAFSQDNLYSCLTSIKSSLKSYWEIEFGCSFPVVNNLFLWYGCNLDKRHYEGVQILYLAGHFRLHAWRSNAVLGRRSIQKWVRTHWCNQ